MHQFVHEGHGQARQVRRKCFEAPQNKKNLELGLVFLFVLTNQSN